MAPGSRVNVLLSEDQAARFEAYCRRNGYKKSTLIARLIREHLELNDRAAASKNDGQKGAGRHIG
jgi:hypothetical protein